MFPPHHSANLLGLYMHSLGPSVTLPTVPISRDHPGPVPLTGPLSSSWPAGLGSIARPTPVHPATLGMDAVSAYNLASTLKYTTPMPPLGYRGLPTALPTLTEMSAQNHRGRQASPSLDTVDRGKQEKITPPEPSKIENKVGLHGVPLSVPGREYSWFYHPYHHDLFR